MQDIDKTPLWRVKLITAYNEMGAAEKRVADYVKEHADECITHSIFQVAQGAGVSEATVVRFCRSIGYQGLKEFKIALAQEQNNTTQLTYTNIEWDDSLKDVKDKIFWGSMKAIRDTYDLIDNDEFEHTVKVLSKAKHIDFCCLGAAGAPVLEYARHQFLTIGVRSQTHTTKQAMYYLASQFSPDSVVLALSCSGETQSVVNVIDAANKAGATTIAVTNYPNSKLAQIADIKLVTVGDSFLGNDRNSLSRFAQLAVINTLYVGIALERGHDEAGDAFNDNIRVH